MSQATTPIQYDVNLNPAQHALEGYKYVLFKRTQHNHCTHTLIYNCETLALRHTRPFTRPQICRWERQSSGRWTLESEMVARSPSRVCPWRVARWWSVWSELILKLLWERSCNCFRTVCHTTMSTFASLARTHQDHPPPQTRAKIVLQLTCLQLWANRRENNYGYVQNTEKLGRFYTASPRNEIIFFEGSGSGSGGAAWQCCCAGPAVRASPPWLVYWRHAWG